MFLGLLAALDWRGYVRRMSRMSASRFGSRAGRAGAGAGALLVVCVALLAGCRADARPAASRATTVAATPSIPQTVAPSAKFSVRTDIGFRSSHYLDEHFAKHGSEFRGISKEEYLLAAQTLRDRPVGGDIEEIVRSDGTASRFDRASGAFLAFDRNGTIRTFFKPNDGERYFRRQAERSY